MDIFIWRSFSLAHLQFYLLAAMTMHEWIWVQMIYFIYEDKLRYRYVSIDKESYRTAHSGCSGLSICYTIMDKW